MYAYSKFLKGHVGEFAAVRVNVPYRVLCLLDLDLFQTLRYIFNNLEQF